MKVEGCQSCHTPHGSPNVHLLKMSNVNLLCLSCHTTSGFANAPGAPSFHNQAAQKYPGLHAVSFRQVHGSNVGSDTLQVIVKIFRWQRQNEGQPMTLIILQESGKSSRQANGEDFLSEGEPSGKVDLRVRVSPCLVAIMFAFAGGGPGGQRSDCAGKPNRRTTAVYANPAWHRGRDTGRTERRKLQCATVGRVWLPRQTMINGNLNNYDTFDNLQTGLSSFRLHPRICARSIIRAYFSTTCRSPTLDMAAIRTTFRGCASRKTNGTTFGRCSAATRTTGTTICWRTR